MTVKKIDPNSLKKFYIDRKRWLRGVNTKKNGDPVPSMLRSVTKGFKGKMCCLGFHGRALNIPALFLNGRMMPWGSSSYWPEWLPGTVAKELAGVNDSQLISQKEREKQIKEIYAKHGVKVIFR